MKQALDARSGRARLLGGATDKEVFQLLWPPLMASRQQQNADHLLQARGNKQNWSFVNQARLSWALAILQDASSSAPIAFQELSRIAGGAILRQPATTICEKPLRRQGPRRTVCEFQPWHDCPCPAYVATLRPQPEYSGEPCSPRAANGNAR